MDTRKLLRLKSASTMVSALCMCVISACGSAQPVVHASFTQTALNAEEGQGPIRVVARLDAPTKSALRVPLRFSGTADLDRDFTAPAALEFTPNSQEATVEVQVPRDGEPECAEAAYIELANSDGPQRRLTINIADQDQAARRLRVGPAREYPTPSAASAEMRPGDVVEIAAGVYEGDVAVWRTNDVVICGEGDGAELKASGKAAEGKAIWVIKGDRVRVENVGFSGAKVSDKNGAGIRAEGRDLTVRHARFIENENGILSGEQRDSTITVEYSRFERNGAGDGYSHNLYIGKIKRLNLRFCTLREAIVGHNVKSRAAETWLEYNRIMDGATGRASYQVDLPNGGLGVLIGNVVQQGPEAENWTMISYGAEGLQYPQNDLYLINNTIVNDRHSGLFVQAPKDASCALSNNLFAGKGESQCANGAQRANVRDDSGFMARDRYEYHLARGAKAIDAGAAPEAVRGFSTQAKFEYDADGAVGRRESRGALDVGAYEYLAP